MSKAAAFIEAEGMVAVFDAVDAMVKATDVTVEGTMRLGGGIVAVALSGALAPVEEATEIGVATARSLTRGKVSSVIFASPSAPVAAIAANTSRIDG